MTKVPAPSLPNLVALLLPLVWLIVPDMVKVVFVATLIEVLVELSLTTKRFVTLRLLVVCRVPRVPALPKRKEPLPKLLAFVRVKVPPVNPMPPVRVLKLSESVRVLFVR